MASVLADQQSERVPKKSRKPLKAKKNPENEDNIMAGNACELSPVGLSSIQIADKENPRHGVRKNKRNNSESLEVELQKMQERLERLTLEKERAEELLKEQDALLKQKEEELEIRGKDQERLQTEIKKLQKLKEFKPNVALPTSKSEDKQKDKKEKKVKKEKKPCSAYILWSKEQWSQVKSENPGAEFKEISNILGSKWKGLSAEEKKPYEDRCQADKQAYQQIVGKEKRENEAMKLLMEQQKQRIAMDLLEQYLQFKQEADKGAKKKGEDPLKPKKPLSAFFLYCNERRAALAPPNNNVLEVARILGEEWKNKTEEEKAPYEEAAKKEKELYSREMELYKQKKAEEEDNVRREEEENTKVQKQEALQLLKRKEKTERIIKKVKETHRKKKENKEKNKDTNKPKRPPTSFLLFSKEARKALMEENPGVNNRTLHALISVRWKELNEADKKIWNDKAAAEMEAYKKAILEYKRSTEDEDNKSLPTDKLESSNQGS